MSVPELTVALAAADDQYRLAFALAAWCQLRRSEVLGLQRRDVHLADAAGLSLSVNRRIATTMTGEVHVGLPKTEAGRRRLAIPSHLVEDIEAHLEQFVGPGSDALLFHRDDGTPVRPITLTRAWARARKAARRPHAGRIRGRLPSEVSARRGVRNQTNESPSNPGRFTWARARKAAGRTDVTLHDLRHTGLTLAAAGGATVAELMHRAGHASPSAAIRYQHATRERDQGIADALADLAISGSVVPLRRRKRRPKSQSDVARMSHGVNDSEKARKQKGL